MTDITANAKAIKEKAEKTAVALGFFDGLHLGHTEVIKRAMLKPGLKSVIFTFNDNTPLPKFQSKEGSCIITHEQKLMLFEKLGIDYIFAPDFSHVKDVTAEDFVRLVLAERLNAAYVVCGYDFRFGKGGEGNPEMLSRICSELGIECETVPAVQVDGEIVSSTAIRKLIREGNVEKANKLLGYELSYSIPVIEGNRLGRTIGFPTINQIIPPEMVQPKRGVYASWTVVDGKTYKSITNIGVKPTVRSSGEVVTETYIIGFSGDLYGKTVRISLRFFLREEVKFEGLSSLGEQLARDVIRSERGY